MSGHRRSIFVSVACQHQNLGDLVLRRDMVQWLTSANTRVVALVGDTPAEALEVIGLPASASAHTSGVAWTRALLTQVAKRRAAVVFAPGPQQLRAGVGGWAREALALTYTLTLPPLGAPVLKVGRSVRGDDRVSLAMERLAARRASMYLVRDDWSRQTLGGRTEVMADISLCDPPALPPALSDQPALDEGTRDTVVLCPRVGRDWPDTEVTRLVDGIRSAGLRLLLVTQVRFDEEWHAALSTRFGIEHLEWGARSSADQLARVEAAYQRSVLTVSDRLHGLLFGVRAGSAPVAWIRGDDDKLAPSLEAAGLPFRQGDEPVDHLLEWAVTSATDRLYARDAAARSLDAARDRVRALIGARA